MDDKTRNKIVDTAKAWKGVKYHHRGTTLSGCDCCGFIVGVLKSLGFLQSYNLPAYPRRWDSGIGTDFLMEEIIKFGEEILKQDTLPGDIVLFKFGSKVVHAGIFIGGSKFMHCHQNTPVRIDTLRTSSWTGRWAKSYRLNLEKM